MRTTPPSKSARLLLSTLTVVVAIVAIVVLSRIAPLPLAEGQARGGQGAALPTAKSSAPIDLTGYWTAVITEDWHVRMPIARKGDFGSGPPGVVSQIGVGRLGEGVNPAQDGNIPYNLKGAQAALTWDPAKDAAEGNPCKAYGAPGIMRQPTHVHFTWQDDNTLKMEADFGNQTRLFHFSPESPSQGGQRRGGISKLEPPAGLGPSLQGYSVGSWIIMGGGGGQANYERSGSLKAVTTHLKPGYYWKNGMPYTGNAVLTENFFLLQLPDNSTWLTVTQLVDDPEYLNEPFVVNYHFKKLPDGSKWNPTPCLVK
jgi:hypothetical protein